MTILFPDPDQVPPRWGSLANGLTLAGLGLLVFGSLTGIPGGDSHAQKVAAVVLLAIAAVAWVAWILVRNSSPEPAVAACLVVVAAAGGALAAFSAVALIFPGVATLAAASRWRLISAVGIGAVGALSVLIATLANGNNFAVVWGGLATVSTAIIVGITRRQAVEHAAQMTRLELASERAEVERNRAELLAERNHLARELHDVLAHTLAALSLHLEAFATVVDAEPETTPQVREQLERTRQLVREGLEEARGAVRALRDDAEPIERRLDRLAAQHDAAFETAGEERPLAPETVLALYRVTQEALTNVVKHAPGASTSILLAFGPERVTVTIDNDVPVSNGVVAPLANTGGGFGLQGIAERVALLGGEVEAGPLGAGWRVTATVPAAAHTRAPVSSSEDPVAS
ncbi:MAG TPA: histidine kinase [Acidimicrobiales bacterium]